MYLSSGRTDSVQRRINDGGRLKTHNMPKKEDGKFSHGFL